MSDDLQTMVDQEKARQSSIRPQDQEPDQRETPIVNTRSLSIQLRSNLNEACEKLYLPFADTKNPQVKRTREYRAAVVADDGYDGAKQTDFDGYDSNQNYELKIYELAHSGVPYLVKASAINPDAAAALKSFEDMVKKTAARVNRSLTVDISHTDLTRDDLVAWVTMQWNKAQKSLATVLAMHRGKNAKNAQTANTLFRRIKGVQKNFAPITTVVNALLRGEEPDNVSDIIGCNEQLERHNAKVAADNVKTS